MNADQYFVRWRGKVSGPFGADLLRAQVQSGQLSKHHSVSADQSNWAPACSLDWLFSSPNAVVVEPISAQVIPPELPAPIPEEQFALASQAATLEERWFYSIDGGAEIGPVSFDLLKQMSKSGQLKAEDQVLKDGAREWMEAREASGLVFARLQKRNTAIPVQNGNANQSVNGSHSITNPNMRFCEACGQILAKSAFACPHCGHSHKEPQLQLRAGNPNSRKSKTTAALLAFFFGGIGVHRFYLGAWGWRIVYVLFCWTGIPAILAFVECIVFLCMNEESFDQKFNR